MSQVFGAIFFMALSAFGAPKKPVHPFLCTGLYGSHTCEHILYLDNCRQTIKVRWEPLLYPGAADIKNKKRAWCSVTWNAAESVEERKFSAPRCEKIMSLIGSALQGFPEVKWQDTACTHLESRGAVLYLRQTWEKPTAPLSETMTAVPAKGDNVAPQSIVLEDVRYCTLHNAVLKRERVGANDQTPIAPNKVKAFNKRTVRCPVIPQNVHSWLSKFLREIDSHLVLKNELK